MSPQPPPDVVAHRQRLKDHAFYLCIKTLICKGKNDLTLSGKLQAELNIDTQKKQAWLNDLINARKNGTLAPNTSMTPY